HLAHKAEHAVDLDTGAVVAGGVPWATGGETPAGGETFWEAGDKICPAAPGGCGVGGGGAGARELGLGKGYPRKPGLTRLKSWNVRSYCPEPDRGRRNWEGREQEREAVYGNRRRIGGERGKRLLRQRGEKVERAFAHMYETGAMRRTHLRRHPNILKRL